MSTQTPDHHGSGVCVLAGCNPGIVARAARHADVRLANLKVAALLSKPCDVERLVAAMSQR
jgi:hypothetical protein